MNKSWTTVGIIFGALALSACQAFSLPSSKSNAIPKSSNSYESENHEAPVTLVPAIPDSDGDGVLDNIDACPKTLEHAVVDDKGCPAAIDLIGRLSMDVRVFFGAQSLTLQSSDSIYNELNKVAIKMREFPQATTAVFGNISTIEAQTNPKNRLAHDRAQLVKEILTTQGVPANSVQTFNCGDRKQIASNDTEAGEILNRRVYVQMFHNDENDYLAQKDTHDCTQF
ncbi:OmpA family protein [Psychrobacter sp. AH5]|uniref:OmpA family protein n=1 Tax=Psychrobacter sp. AH5 TaxID=2937433 RepID=UPI00333E4BFB